MLFAGFAMPITNGSMFAILQEVIAPEMQGRVFALVFSLSAGMAPLGLILAGPVADAIGVRSWYLVGGVVCALMGVIAFFIPSITHLEEKKTNQ
jgi:MFS transporter, DHA3 family, macrolide efflux protein